MICERLYIYIVSLRCALPSRAELQPLPVGNQLQLISKYKIL
jgi:hypothetical protein